MGLLGGSSKSKSEQTISAWDNRGSATDNAVVWTGNGPKATGGIALNGANNKITITDGGAFALVGEALDSHEKIILDVLSGASSAVDGASSIATAALQSISENADKAFEFIDKNFQDAQSRSANTLIPWVIAGISVVAIAHAMRK